MMRIAMEPLVAFLGDLLMDYGLSEPQARSVAHNTIWSAMVGRDNFSFGRLPIHIRRVREGVLNPVAEPAFTASGDSIVLVDGKDGFGHFVGELSMAKAIERAAGTGVGVAVARNSNFFGTGAFFVNMAAEAGMVGVAMSNSFPKVVAQGGTKAVLGTNPFAFGVPRRDGRHVLFDMATSALAGSTVRQHIAEGTPLPEGLAVDGDGAPITDPNAVAEGALTPFGGAKGYGLALFVEILSGVLAGAGVSQGVASLYSDFTQSGHSGHFFLALDITRFMPLDRFHDRLDMLRTLLVQSGPEGAVNLPGEVRWQHFEENARLGIALTADHQRILSDLAGPVGISLPWETVG